MMRESNKFYLQVREVVNQVDPVGLISIGSPPDEYDPEIELFISDLEGRNKDEIRDSVYYAFKSMFNGAEGEDDTRYKYIASKLFDLVQDNPNYHPEYWKDFKVFQSEFESYIYDSTPETFLYELRNAIDNHTQIGDLIKQIKPLIEREDLEQNIVLQEFKNEVRKILEESENK